MNPSSETLTRAAAILRQKATDLREAHTVPPEHEEWRKDALAKEAEYAELMSVVAELGELERASETPTLIDDVNELRILHAGRQPWIPCSERMPEDGQIVIVWAKDDDDWGWTVAQWDADVKEWTDRLDISCREDINDTEVTHWLPAPGGPK